MTVRPRSARAWTLLVAAVIAIACTATPPVPTPELSGGTLRVAMDIASYESFQLDIEADPPRFDHAWDPTTTWAQEPFELFRCCLLRTLMSYNGLSTSEGGAELRPDVAASYPDVSADGLQWSFTLQDGLHYAPPMEETQILATDFIRALERALRPDPFASPDDPHIFGPYAFYLQEVIAGAEEFGNGSVSSISGLEAPNPLTLVIHLTRPAGDLGARLAMPAAAPIPAGAADGHDAGYGPYLVASGPYMMEGAIDLDPSLPPDLQPKVSGYVRGSSLTLVRNPSWHQSTDLLRAAYPDRIEILHNDDYEAVLGGIQNGQFDLGFGFDLDPEDIARLRSDSATSALLHVTPALTVDWITMNLAVPPFDDVHVRRAVNLITNKRRLVELLHPEGTVQSHAIPDAFVNGLLAEYAPYATVDDAGSLDRARAEMSQSIYDVDGDGVCDASPCQAIRLPVRDDLVEYGPAADAFAADLARIGIDLDVERVSADDYFGEVFEQSAHLPMAFTFGWGSDYLNASSWFGPLATSAGIDLESSGNLSLIGASSSQLANLGYALSEVPGLEQPIQACLAETGAAQFQCWAQVDQYLMERIVPWVPLDARQASRLTSARVRQFSFDTSLTMPALDRIVLEQGQ